VKENRELTPVKAALIYTIALFIVVFYELPRVHSWMEETRWKIASGEMFDGFVSNPLRFVSNAPGAADKAGQVQNDDAGEAAPQDRKDLPQDVKEAGSETAQGEAPSPAPSQDAAGPPLPPDQSGAGNMENPAAQSTPQPRDSEEPAATTPAPRLKPHKVLLVGDSMIAEGFGPALQRRLRKLASIEVIRKGQYSTGFVHQDDFNWAAVLKEFIQDYTPDLIVIHMGANDPIDILDESGKRLYCGNDRWRAVYASRIREFLLVTSEKKVLSFWVGLPIMSSDKYCSKIRVINSIVEQECTKISGCVYFDSWSALTDSRGNYTAFVKGPGGKQTRIRAKDNVHLTEAGGAILTDYFLRAARDRIDLPTGDESGPDRTNQ
jgi:hypothetical protein